MNVGGGEAGGRAYWGGAGGGEAGDFCGGHGGGDWELGVAGLPGFGDARVVGHMFGSSVLGWLFYGLPVWLGCWGGSVRDCVRERARESENDM